MRSPSRQRVSAVDEVGLVVPQQQVFPRARRFVCGLYDVSRHGSVRQKYNEDEEHHHTYVV